ncbi:MAG: hypothetical protein IKO03_04080 [Lachnospiraceae bacterium]|nr:hypothetical protein [Lachnospiraceae bacterium]
MNYNYYKQKGYVYYFSDEGSSCDRLKIEKGDLNSGVKIMYHDGKDKWSEWLHFKYKNQPDHLIWEDADGNTYDYYTTDLSKALRLRDERKIIDY